MSDRERILWPKRNHPHFFRLFAGALLLTTGGAFIDLGCWLGSLAVRIERSVP